MILLATAGPALMAAGFVGTWNTNVTAGLSILDEGAASLLAGNISLAGKPLSVEAALACTHPEDRMWVFDRIRRVRQTGGAFSAEFRVLTASGNVRWVLNRGTLVPDHTGMMQGSGAYIDTTDTHTRSFIPAASLPQIKDDPLIIAADRCIEAHTAIKRSDRPDLRYLTEALLSGIGRALAQRRGD